jgi:hypothetical protein
MVQPFTSAHRFTGIMAIVTTDITGHTGIGDNSAVGFAGESRFDS